MDAVEARPDKHRQPLFLVTPELFVIDQLAGRLQQRVDLRRAPPGGAEALGGGRQQVAQADRVLADFAPGRVGRQVDRDGWVLVVREQFVQVVSEQHD